MICETLPLTPDVGVEPGERELSEPVEVGPFREGSVFVHVETETEGEGDSVQVAAALSPTGYQDWETHWVVDEERSLGPGMHLLRLSNFGNWLRLRFRLEDSAAGAATARAWFVGKG
jgi:hypothetical protein